MTFVTGQIEFKFRLVITWSKLMVETLELCWNVERNSMRNMTIVWHLVIKRGGGGGWNFSKMTVMGGGGHEIFGRMGFLNALHFSNLQCQAKSLTKMHDKKAFWNR